MGKLIGNANVRLVLYVVTFVLLAVDIGLGIFRPEAVPVIMDGIVKLLGAFAGILAAANTGNPAP